MTEPTSAQELFRGRHFDQESIILCVRWYLTFKLSLLRDLVQIMAERGIALAHTTILRWVQRYVPDFEPFFKIILGLAAQAVIWQRLQRSLKNPCRWLGTWRS